MGKRFVRQNRRQNRRQKQSVRNFFTLSQEEIELILNFRRRKKNLRKKEKGLEYVERYGKPRNQTSQTVIDYSPLTKTRDLTPRNENKNSEKPEIYETNQKNQIDEEKNEDINTLVNGPIKEKNEKEIIKDKIELKKEQIEKENDSTSYDIETAKTKFTTLMKSDGNTSKFIKKNVPLEDLIIMDEKLIEKKREKLEANEKRLKEWMKLELEVLEAEKKNISLLMEYLAYLDIKNIESTTSTLNVDEKKEKIKKFLLRGSYIVSGVAFDIIANILSKKDISSKLPERMEPDNRFKKLIKPEKEDIWLICGGARATLEAWKLNMQLGVIHCLNCIYNENYEKISSCWVGIAACEEARKYTSKILSGLKTGETKIVLPKE